MITTARDIIFNLYTDGLVKDFWTENNSCHASEVTTIITREKDDEALEVTLWADDDNEEPTDMLWTRYASNEAREEGDYLDQSGAPIAEGIEFIKEWAQEA